MLLHEGWHPHAFARWQMSAGEVNVPQPHAGSRNLKFIGLMSVVVVSP